MSKSMLTTNQLTAEDGQNVKDHASCVILLQSADGFDQPVES